jgi:hypothetical protein
MRLPAVPHPALVPIADKPVEGNEADFRLVPVLLDLARIVDEDVPVVKVFNSARFAEIDLRTNRLRNSAPRAASLNSGRSPLNESPSQSRLPSAPMAARQAFVSPCPFATSR